MKPLEAVADVRKAQERLRARIETVLAGKGEATGVSVVLVLREALAYIDMERTVSAYLTLSTLASESRARREGARPLSFYEAETLDESTSSAVVPAASRARK